MKHLASIFRGKKTNAWLLIFLAWLAYTSSYLGKVNYSANITQIIDFYGISKAQAGAVPTFFFFAYGVGQVLNGIACKKYNIKWIIFASLLISATINLIIAVSQDFSIIKWLWLINGFVLSILWPTLVRLLSEMLPKKLLATSSVVMGTTVALGTLVVYGLSSVYALFNKFKFSFYTAGFTVVAVALVWLLFFDKAVAMSKGEQVKEETAEKVETDMQSEKQERQEGRKNFFMTLHVLCFCAIGVNLIKDGLTTWVPSILKEEFSMNDSLSILLTLFLPIVAMFGNFFALKLHKHIPDYVNHCGVVFATIAVFIGFILGSLSFKVVVCMLIGLVVVNFLASSLNSLITVIFPLFMRGKGNSGFFAGILNGFCYVGSTISSYGLGAIADNFGWTYVFWTLIGFCVLTFFMWSVYAWFNRVSIGKNSVNV